MPSAMDSKNAHNNAYQELTSLMVNKNPSGYNANKNTMGSSGMKSGVPNTGTGGLMRQPTLTGANDYNNKSS